MSVNRKQGYKKGFARLEKTGNWFDHVHWAAILMCTNEGCVI